LARSAFRLLKAIASTPAVILPEGRFSGWVAPMVWGGVENLFFWLRFLILGIAIALSIVTRFYGGISVPILGTSIGIGIYSLLIRLFVWWRPPRSAFSIIQLLSIESFVSGLAVYFTGGYKSSFYIFFLLVAGEAAVYMKLLVAVVVSITLGAIHTAVCFLPQIVLQEYERIYATYVSVLKLSMIAGAGTLTGLLVDKLRNEELMIERESFIKRLQDGFISSLSHELKTPITAMRTSLEILRDVGDMPEETRKELLSIALRHIQRLEMMVNGLLESTKIETGQINLSKKVVDMRKVMERVVRDMEPIVMGKDQTIDISLPREKILCLLDRRRIEQVLSNLISNAHKFAPKGGRIWVSLKRVGKWAVVSVEDDGPGVPEEELTRIFEKFYVGTKDPALAGTGLGLYIAKQLVMLHGGNIWAESDGKGGVFRFSIPLFQGSEEEEDEDIGCR